MLKKFYGGRIDAEDEANNRRQGITDENAYYLTENAFLLFYERVQPVDIYTREERTIQNKSPDLISPSYPLLKLSQCRRVNAANIGFSLINKYYYHLLKPEMIDYDKHFVSLSIYHGDSLLNMFRYIIDELKLKDYVEKEKYNSELLVFPFNNSIYDIKSTDRQAPWIWMWIRYLFTIFIHRSDANERLDYYIKELD
jgi:hypothetical protein